MSGHVVVVGGGLAGGSLVTELRARGYDGPITVVCAEPHPPYERPPLSKSLLRGESQPEATYLHPPAWYDDHGISLVTSTEVIAADLGGHRVRTSAGDLEYGKLVLATGCRARRLDLGTAGAEVHHLRTLQDAERLRQALVAGVRLLVVGGGWIGLEVAASARATGADVTLVEPAAQPLSGSLGPEVGGWFAELHRAHGVDLRTGVGLRSLEGGEAFLDDGSRLQVDVVVAGIGAIPNDELARDAGLEVANGVVVDASLTTSHPDVLAVGDVAAHQHPVLGERIRVEHWQNAQSQGRLAAAVLAGDSATYRELPSFFSDQYDAGLEFFGHLGPRPAEVTVDRAEDGLVARWHRDGRIVAAGHVNQWGSSEALAEEVRRDAERTA